MPKANVVCLLNVDSHDASFKWSEGAAHFEPYTLDGMPLRLFKKFAGAARERLSDLVKDCEFRESIRQQIEQSSEGSDLPLLERLSKSPEYAEAERVVGASSYELAKVGFQLYEQMFRPSQGDKENALKVRQWLENLRDRDYVDTLEVVMERAWTLPWNVVYDKQPDKERFLTDVGDPDLWHPFWGIQYNLVGGRPVDPLRRLPLFHDPHVLVVADPGVLPDDELKLLTDVVEKHRCHLVTTKDVLESELQERRPDVLYWLSHATPDGLVLGNDEVTPEDLYCWMMSYDTVGGLAFLNACQTAEPGEEGSFFEAFHNAGFSGIIGTEQQTYNLFANRLGIEFLDAFLGQRQMVGEVLQRLRGRVPLGLVYGTYCPPHIRVEASTEQVSLKPRPSFVAADAAFGSIALGKKTRPLANLPEDPYRSLAYYEYSDRALFAGREADVQRFSRLFDDDGTRMLVLHGESGVGKSSFLRAGVIPYLEDECHGYRFLRDEQGQGDSVLLVRATSDVFGQLALALQRFCSTPYRFETPLDEVVEVDLPTLLADLGEPAELAELLRQDPAMLAQLLAELGNQLPFSVVLVVDQAEELFTLARSPEETACSEAAIEMLRRTVHGKGNFKVVVSLRTEYCGRLVTKLRRGVHDTRRIHEYLLADFDSKSIEIAIRRPTSATASPAGSESPRDKYRFTFADGVPEEIARRVLNATRQRGDSVLPLVQVICTQLYEPLRRGRDGISEITLSQLDNLGGVDGALRRHVHNLVQRLAGNSEDEAHRIKQLLARLYLRQPDGSLTTALVPADELEAFYRRSAGPGVTSTTSFSSFIGRAEAARLIRVNASRGENENQDQQFISLGHDALANLIAEWDEEYQANAKQQKMIGLLAIVSMVAIAMTLLAGAARYHAAQADRNLKRAQENFDLAVESVENSLAIAPGDASLVNKTVSAYQDVIKNIQHLESKRPGDPRLLTSEGFARNSIGAVYQLAGDLDHAKDAYDEAITVRKKVVERQPNNPTSLRLLANAYMNRGQLTINIDGETDFGQAQKLRQRARELGHESPELRRDLAIGDVHRGDYDAAIEVLHQLLDEPELDQDEIKLQLASAACTRAIKRFEQFAMMTGDTTRRDAKKDLEHSIDAAWEAIRSIEISQHRSTVETRIRQVEGIKYLLEEDAPKALDTLTKARQNYESLSAEYLQSIGIPASDLENNKAAIRKAEALLKKSSREDGRSGLRG